MIFARRRESPGDLIELKQNFITRISPPQRPAIAADIIFMHHANFAKRRSHYLSENKGSKTPPPQKRSRQHNEK